MFRIIKILSLLGFIVTVMSSCMQIPIRYESKKFDKKVILDSNCFRVRQSIKSVTELTDKGLYEVKDYNKDGILIGIATYSDTTKHIIVGEMKRFFDDGRIKYIGNYNRIGQYDGSVSYYYPNGQLKRKEIYKDSVYISTECFTEDGKPESFYPYRVDPSVDMNFVKYLVYPEKAVSELIQEKVRIALFINHKNQICQYNYDSGNTIELVNAAIEAIVKYGNPKSGLENNEPVSSWLIVPVTFKLK